tara:strand:- start:1163 stop:2173 length:1011 start_codon:yes stop_codon:yes gene_type:complete
MNYYYYSFFILLVFCLIFISKKFNLFLDQKKDNHKKFVNPKNNYFLGGIILFLFILSISINKEQYFDLIFISSIFLLGILSDLKVLNDPKKRFILQGIIIFLFVFLLEIKIPSTRLELFDFYLQNSFINSIFVVFCLMILINGSNFIDGLNTLLILNKILILLIFILFFSNNLIFDYNNYEFLFVLLFLLALNALGLIILGDSGAYVISLIFGISLINFANQNYFISPYFIILLIWYPCFELLFSIIRRITSNKKSYNPDKKHLHQLLYLIIAKKNKLDFKLNHLITSFLINSYNFLILFLGINFIYQTKILIIIIFLNIIIYLLIYNLLTKKIKN